MKRRAKKLLFPRTSKHLHEKEPYHSETLYVNFSGSPSRSTEPFDRETEMTSKTPAEDKTRDGNETVHKNKSEPCMLPDSSTDFLQNSKQNWTYEARNRDIVGLGIGQARHESNSANETHVLPSIQYLEQPVAVAEASSRSPPSYKDPPSATACSRPTSDNMGYRPGQMQFIVVSGSGKRATVLPHSSAKNDVRSHSAADVKLLKGVIMIKVQALSSKSVAVVVCVLIGCDSEKLREAEQKKVVAGYQETETFECKMCNNGKSLRVEMEHVSWMTDVRTEKTAFDNGVDDLWSDIVMSNVFHMRSNDAVRQDVSLDSNFYAVIVVRQTDRQLQTIAIAQDLHDCITPRPGTLPHCCCHRCTAETKKQPPISEVRARPQQQPLKHGDKAVKPHVTGHPVQRVMRRRRLSDTTESSSDTNANCNFQSETELKYSERHSIPSSDDGPKCGMWSYKQPYYV